MKHHDGASYWLADGLSPPTRGRGLKLAERVHLSSLAVVAPHAGAWIETSTVGCCCAFR